MLDRLPLFVTLATGAAIGLFWPTAHSPSAQYGSEVAVAKSADGQFYVDASVNGQKTRFLVDTGASEVALTKEDAEAAGIPIDSLNYQLIGQGASGIVRGAHVTIDRIDLDGVHEQKVDAVVVPGASVSLLGQPFLDKLDEIVIRKGEMRLRYNAG